ncbi:FDLD family class I lanthipeptide [Tumebacillus avium]|nr:FDLD family class I lanthipeptide [Tumebacillus avium]
MENQNMFDLDLEVTSEAAEHEMVLISIEFCY